MRPFSVKFRNYCFNPVEMKSGIKAIETLIDGKAYYAFRTEDIMNDFISEIKASVNGICRSGNFCQLCNICTSEIYRIEEHEIAIRDRHQVFDIVQCPIEFFPYGPFVP